FRSAEIIREKLMHVLHQEVPYGLGVEIEHIAKTEDERWLVHALIWLERESHKPIVIGKGGEVLKQVGREARLELCDLLGRRVRLEMWVKVRGQWSDSDRERKRLGFDVGYAMADKETVRLERGFVLHQRPYRNTSQLLECVTAAHGRVGLVARGSRAGRGSRRALLQPFTPLRLSWTRRGELGTLTDVEPDGPPAALTGEALLA